MHKCPPGAPMRAREVAAPASVNYMPLYSGIRLCV